MQFKSSNFEDIRKYYQGTYIKLKEYGDTLFRIDSVSSNCVSGMVEDGREFLLYMNDDHPYEIDYVLPHKSFFQYGKDACLLYRIPARQYMRGLSPQNTDVAKFSPDGVLKTGGELDFEVLKAFVSKQPFFSLSTATGKANPNGLRSFVLTSRMAYHRASKGIYIDFTRVADVDAASKTVTMRQNIFTKEVADFIQKTGDEFKVQQCL